MVGMVAKMKPGEKPVPPAYSGPVIRHARTGTGVFIGGDYIQLGFRTNSLIGKMGTNDRPSGWYGRQGGRNGIGMTANALGFKKGGSGLTIDYFLPGSPEESFWVGYNGITRRNCGNKVEDLTKKNSPDGVVRTTALVDGKLEVIQIVTLSVGAHHFKNEITIKNIGSATLSRVRFMRSVDPDNTVDDGGSYRTIQKLEQTIPVDGAAVVSAKSSANDPYYRSTGNQANLVYYSTDKRAKASFGASGLSPRNVYDPRVWDAPPSRGSSTTQDAYISMAFDIGKLSPGKTETLVYYTSLDNRPVKEVVKSLKKAALPVLTLTQMKCCTVAPKPLLKGNATC